MRKFFVILSVLALLAVAVVPGFAQDEPGTIADIVVASAGADEPEFTMLLAAVSAADPAVLEALSDPEAEFTVFAPTDAAFAAIEGLDEIVADTELLTSILTFHVVEGAIDSETLVGLLDEMGGSISVPSLNGQYIDAGLDEDGNVNINGAGLVMTDIDAANGIIHVIDAVILPESRTIADIVVESAGDEEAPEFTTLLAAVSAADPAVLELLSNPEAELTVFAPTDEAFGAVEGLEAIVADTELLTTILQYHVVASEVYSGDVVTLLEENDGSFDVEMANGSTATISATEEGIFINQAQIILTDIDAANGVIHVIDAVIVPAE